MAKVNKKDKYHGEPITKAVSEEIDKVIRESSPAEVETTVPETDKYGKIANALHVNVRKEPNLQAEVLEVLREGDQVKLLDKLPNFWEVSTSTHSIAYIASEFIEEV